MIGNPIVLCWGCARLLVAGYGVDARNGVSLYVSDDIKKLGPF